MTIKDIIEIYELKKKLYGIETYKYISEIFAEIKGLHESYVKSKGIKDSE